MHLFNILFSSWLLFGHVYNFAAASGACGDEPLDLVLVIQKSAFSGQSQRKSQQNFKLLKTSLKTLVDKIDISSKTTRIGLVSFSDTTKHLCKLKQSKSKSQIQNTIDDIKQSGKRSNLDIGLKQVEKSQLRKNFGDRNVVPNVIIIVLYGSIPNFKKSLSQAKKIQKSGTRIFVVKIGSDGENYAKLLSSKPQRQGKNYFLYSNYVSVKELAGDLIEHLCPGDAMKLPPSMDRKEFLTTYGLGYTNFSYVSEMVPKLKHLALKYFGRKARNPKIKSPFIGDVLLSPKQIVPLFGWYNGAVSKRRKRAGYLPTIHIKVKRWGLPIKYILDVQTLNSADNVLILNAIKHIEKHSCIYFEKGNITAREGNIDITMFNGCGTKLGPRDIDEFPEYPHVIELGDCEKKILGTVVHELLHAVGFIHEHSRSDRDKYVTINDENILVSFEVQFTSDEEAKTRDLPYDYGSIMHYSSTAFNNEDEAPTITSKQPLFQRSMGQRSGLSFNDIKMINLVYCDDVCPKKLDCKRGGITNPKKCSECICPDGYGGTLCETVGKNDPACVPRSFDIIQVNSDTERCLESPNYRIGFYGTHIQCNWYLQAEPGKRIDLYFKSNFNVYCDEDWDSCFHWVEIKYGQDLGIPGPRFCCYETPDVRLTSAGNEAVISFRSDFDGPEVTSNKTQGFQLCYKLSSETGTVPTMKATPKPTTKPTTISTTTQQKTTNRQPPTTPPPTKGPPVTPKPTETTTEKTAKSPTEPSVIGSQDCPRKDEFLVVYSNERKALKVLVGGSVTFIGSSHTISVRTHQTITIESLTSGEYFRLLNLRFSITGATSVTIIVMVPSRRDKVQVRRIDPQPTTEITLRRGIELDMDGVDGVLRILISFSGDKNFVTLSGMTMSTCQKS